MKKKRVTGPLRGFLILPGFDWLEIVPFCITLCTSLDWLMKNNIRLGRKRWFRKSHPERRAVVPRARKLKKKGKQKNCTHIHTMWTIVFWKVIYSDEKWNCVTCMGSAIRLITIKILGIFYRYWSGFLGWKIRPIILPANLSMWYNYYINKYIIYIYTHYDIHIIHIIYTYIHKYWGILYTIQIPYVILIYNLHINIVVHPTIMYRF